MKKESDNIILPVEIIDPTSKTSRRILNGLLQLKNFMLSVITNSKVIISKATCVLIAVRLLFTRNLNTHLFRLKLDYTDNSNIYQTHLGNKDFHLNQKSKERLALNFFRKTRKIDGMRKT